MASGWGLGICGVYLNSFVMDEGAPIMKKVEVEGLIHSNLTPLD